MSDFNDRFLQKIGKDLGPEISASQSSLQKKFESSDAAFNAGKISAPVPTLNEIVADGVRNLAGGNLEIDYETDLFLRQSLPLWATNLNSSLGDKVNLNSYSSSGDRTKAALNHTSNEELARLLIVNAANPEFIKGIVTVKKKTRTGRATSQENAIPLATQGPEEWDGQTDLDFGYNPTTSPPGKRKELLHYLKNRSEIIGGLLVRPVDASLTGIKPVFIPFQFNPDISESGYEAQYESISILGKVGNIHSYLRTDVPSLSINLKYLVTSKKLTAPSATNPNQIIDWINSVGFMNAYNYDYVKSIETILRALTLPSYNMNEDSRNDIFLAPPIINVVLGDFKYDPFIKGQIDNDNQGTFQEYSYLGTNNIQKTPGNSKNIMYKMKKFIATSVTIKKDFQNGVIIDSVNDESIDNLLRKDKKNLRRGAYDTAMFECSINLQEVTNTYDNFVFDYYSHYTKFINFFNTIDQTREGLVADLEKRLQEIEDIANELGLDVGGELNTQDGFITENERKYSRRNADETLEYNGYVAAYQAAKQTTEREIRNLNSNFSSSSLYSLYENQLSIIGENSQQT